MGAARSAPSASRPRRYARPDSPGRRCRRPHRGCRAHELRHPGPRARSPPWPTWLRPGATNVPTPPTGPRSAPLAPAPHDRPSIQASGRRWAAIRMLGPAPLLPGGQRRRGPSNRAWLLLVGHPGSGCRRERPSAGSAYCCRGPARARVRSRGRTLQPPRLPGIVNPFLTTSPSST